MQGGSISAKAAGVEVRDANELCLRSTAMSSPTCIEHIVSGSGERSERCKHLWAMHPLQAYSEDQPSLPEVIATLMFESIATSAPLKNQQANH